MYLMYQPVQIFNPKLTEQTLGSLGNYIYRSYNLIVLMIVMMDNNDHDYNPDRI